MDPVIFFILTILVIVGKFADFLADNMMSEASVVASPPTKADPQEKATESDLPKGGEKSASSSDGQPLPRPDYLRLAMVRTDSFFDFVFGGKTSNRIGLPLGFSIPLGRFTGSYIDRLGIFHCFLISMFFVQGTLVFSALFKSDTWSEAEAHFPWAWVWGGLLGLTLANFLVDIVSVLITRGLMNGLIIETGDPKSAPEAGSPARTSGTPAPPKVQKDLNTKGAWFVLCLFPVFVLIFYILFVGTMNISFTLILSLRWFATGYHELSAGNGFPLFSPDLWGAHATVFYHDTLPRLFNPVEEGRRLGVAGLNAIYFCITPLIPPLLVLLAAVSGFLMNVGDHITGGRLTDVVGTMSKQNNPIFLIVASALALLGSAATVLMGAFK